MQGITFITSSNHDEVLQRHFLLSPCLAEPNVECLVQKGLLNTAAAYNAAAAQARHDLVCFVDPDLYLEEAWLERFFAGLEAVQHGDPDWACLGISGALRSQDAKLLVGHFSEGDEVFGPTAPLPIAVDGVDDMLVVCRRDDAHFDEWMPNGNLLATEFCLRMRRDGRQCYVIDAPCKRRRDASRGKLPLDYLLSCGYLYARYPDMLPILASRVTIQQSQGVCILTA